MLLLCSTVIIVQYHYYCAVPLLLYSTVIIVQYHYYFTVPLLFCSTLIIVQYRNYCAVLNETKSFSADFPNNTQM